MEMLCYLKHNTIVEILHHFKHNIMMHGGYYF